MRAEMRKSLTVLAGTAAVMFLVAASASAQGGGGILGTKHNLSTSGTGAIHVTTGTAEVCVFCHTPHGADTSVSAPLWNRAINTTGYTMYSSDTLDATMDTQPTGVSLACLSCHDGTIAFDALRNLPGPGGFTDTPSKDGTSTWTFVGATGKKMPAGITNIGQDLTNDHPISMVYTTAKSPSSTSQTNDHATGFKDPQNTGSNGNSWFNNGVRLYAGKVQCASCHDPHTTNVTFLRTSNDASALCLTCHKKDG